MSTENKPKLDIGALMAAHVASFTFEDPVVAREKRVLAPFRAKEGVFNALSLTAWSKIAQDAGVPSIPAAVVLEIPVDVITRFDRPEPGDEQHYRNLKEIMANVPAGHMLRWDCCAALNLKFAMDGGELDRAAMTSIEYDDPRFFDILYDYPGASMAVLQRPWIEARKVGSHPVEYRVYVENNEVQGISSYYPQRPLVLDDDVRREIEESLAFSKDIIAAANAAGTTPWMAGYERAGLDSTNVSCTLDFLVTESGDVQFIEAGPPFGAGAHPCCFQHNVVNGAISVKGVALVAKEPALALDEFMKAGAAAGKAAP